MPLSSDPGYALDRLLKWEAIEIDGHSGRSGTQVGAIERSRIHNAVKRKCSKTKLAVLFLSGNRGIFHSGPLVPPVETREVTRIPCLAESGFAQIPVRADFAGHDS